MSWGTLNPEHDLTLTLARFKLVARALYPNVVEYSNPEHDLTLTLSLYFCDPEHDLTLTLARFTLMARALYPNVVEFSKHRTRLNPNPRTIETRGASALP